MKDKRRPRLYFLLVELDTGEKAALLIIRFPGSFGAQITGHDEFLRQISCKVDKPDFESMDTWHFLAMVEEGFERVHGIDYGYLRPVGKMTYAQWAAAVEARAADPRYIVWEEPGSKVWHYGVKAVDLPAMGQEIREDVLGPEGMKILRDRLQRERRDRALH